jgi:creatinine amidohydrolase
VKPDVRSWSPFGDRMLARLTSPAAAQARGAAVLVPTGSVEQHGPHLPVGTDTLIAWAIAREVASTMDGVLVAEPIAYGCSWHHMGFPGTVTLRVTTFVAIVVDVCQSLLDKGFIPILLNGHAGNRAALDVALVELAETGYECAALTYFDLIQEDARALIPDAPTATGHACALETSISLYLWPDAVDSNAIPAGDTPGSWPDPHMFAKKEVALVRRFEEINPTGVIGRPALATAEMGERLFNAAVHRCRDAVDRARLQLSR